jgi:hypothetical protein
LTFDAVDSYPIFFLISHTLVSVCVSDCRAPEDPTVRAEAFPVGGRLTEITDYKKKANDETVPD